MSQASERLLLAGHQEAGDVRVGTLAQLLADIVKADHLHPAAHVLQGDHQAEEITVAGEQHDAVEVARLQQGVDGQIHVGIGLGGDVAVLVLEAAHGLLDDLEAALAQDVVVAVHLLPVLGVAVGALRVFGQVAVGAQHDRIGGVGQVDEHVVAHAETAAHLDVFGVDVDSRPEHAVPFLLTGARQVVRVHHSHSMVAGGLEEMS